MCGSGGPARGGMNPRSIAWICVSARRPRARGDEPPPMNGPIDIDTLLIGGPAFAGMNRMNR